MFGSVFAYVLVLGGLGEGRGGGGGERGRSSAAKTPYRVLWCHNTWKFIPPIEYTLVPLAEQHLLQLCISSNIPF